MHVFIGVYKGGRGEQGRPNAPSTSFTKNNFFATEVKSET